MKVQRFKWNCGNKSTFPAYSNFLERVCMSELKLKCYRPATVVLESTEVNLSNLFSQLAVETLLTGHSRLTYILAVHLIWHSFL